MSYRNDHEAALARVDALEHELAKMREPHLPAPRRSKVWLFVGVCIAVVAGGIVGGGVVGVTHTADEPRPQPLPPKGTVGGAVGTVDRTMLTACANAIQPTPSLDEVRTDPRAEHPASVEPIGRTAAPCRADLHGVVFRSDLSPEEREALWKWAVKEDELAGAITRIEVYYASDPYKLDNYSTAKQLWLEYDRAYDARNFALTEWRAKF